MLKNDGDDSSMNNKKTIIIATGGTGGHIFPAEALARKIIQADEQQQINIVVISDKRKADKPESGFKDDLSDIKRYRIFAAGISGRTIWRRFFAYFQLIIGILQAAIILYRLRPVVAVGFGGYPCVPTLLAAEFLKIPVVIHEQNAVLGRANRLLAKRASRIATSFQTTKFLSENMLGKSEWTGNPVRDDFLAKEYILKGGKINILVTGGSQGAYFMGDIVPKAFDLLSDDIKCKIHITQQVRHEQLSAVKVFYKAANIDATVVNFIDDMANQLSKSHLIIARSGASTIAEIIAVGRPAILVPLPGSIDGHQMANASYLCDKGGAWLMHQDDCTP